MPLKDPDYLVMSHQSKEEELYKLQAANKMGKVGRVDVMRLVIELDGHSTQEHRGGSRNTTCQQL